MAFPLESVTAQLAVLRCCLRGTEDASGLLWMQGRSKGTEEYHLTKGGLGPVPWLQDRSLFSHLAQIFCALNFCSNSLGLFREGGAWGYNQERIHQPPVQRNRGACN